MTTVTDERTLMQVAANDAKYERHHLSEVWGNMPDNQFQEFVEEYKKDHKQQMVVLYEGKVLDGWHRYMASLTVGLEPFFNELNAGIDPVAYVIQHNGLRRHLEPSQRASIIVHLNDWAERGRPKTSTVADLMPVMTNSQMAGEAGVSERTITNARTAESGGLGDAVRSGEMSATAAANQVREQNRPAQYAPPVDAPPDDEPARAVAEKELYCANCGIDVEPNNSGECPRCGGDLATANAMNEPVAESTPSEEPVPMTASEAKGQAKTATIPMEKLTDMQETIARQVKRIELLEEENRLLKEGTESNTETSRTVADQRAIIETLESETRILTEDKQHLQGQVDRQGAVLRGKDSAIAKLEQEINELKSPTEGSTSE